MQQQTYARVSDGVVVSIFDAPSRIAPPAGWAACDPSVQVGWISNGASFAAPFAAPLTVAQLADRLSAAAKASADAVTAQVATCETHLAGYTNAAMYVAAAGGVPANDPVKTAFAAMAAANGLTSAAFATLCDGLSATAMTLSAALATVQVAAAKAATASDLASALTAYEAALTGLVEQMNTAGLTVTIEAPAAITIPGINV